MACRIHEYVLRGEIRAATRNCVSGWLEVLRTQTARDKSVSVQPSTVVLSFTGNVNGELAGRNFRFEVRPENLPAPRPVLDESFATQQIGVVGDMQYRIVRVPLVPIPEFIAARERGESPPEEQQPSLYLEWYSQNGRVVLDLVNPIIEFEGSDQHLADPQPEPLPESFPDVPGITMIEQQADGSYRDVDLSDLDADDDDDPYQLFDDDLESQLQSSLDADLPEDGAQSVDVLIEESVADDMDPWQPPPEPRDWAEVIPGIDPETKAMYEQWDEVIYGTKIVPLTWLFESPLQLPRPADVRDEEHAWQALHQLLMAMAQRGVAFDMCRHFTAQQAYSLLIDELLPEAGVHPDLVATGFIQHFSSSERCPLCEAEFDEEWKRTHPAE